MYRGYLDKKQNSYTNRLNKLTLKNKNERNQLNRLISKKIDYEEK